MFEARENPSRCASRARLATAVACAVIFAAGTARAQVAAAEEAAAPGEELVRAYHTGLGSAASGERFEIDRFGSSYLLRAVGADAGTDLTCMLCTDDELQSQARSLGVMVAARRAGSSPALVYAPGLLTGDRILIDGVPFAPAAANHPITPGAHDVEIVRGETVSRSEVQILVSGEVRLEPTRPFRGRTSKRRAGVVLTGLGVAAAALGGVFLWLDGACSTDKEDQDGDCAEQHQLVIPGWSLVGAGAVSAVIGLVLMLLPEEREEEGEDETEAAP